MKLGTKVRMAAATNEEQIARWVEGLPLHRGDRDDRDSECCPDFSCCYPDLLQPLEVRRAFQIATPAKRDQLLGAFLAALVEKVAPGAHIAGRGTPE